MGWIRFTPSDLYCAATAIAVAQLYSDFKFWRLLRREVASPPPGPAKALPATLIIPCKGAGEGFDANVRALLDQDYPGELELLFVTPSESDPAFARLKDALSGNPRARVLASGAVPTRSSGKIVDLFFALDRAAPGSEVLLFADADIRVPRTWSRDMAAALDDPEVVIATSALLYVPERKGLWNFLRLVWMGIGVPYAVHMECVTGQSIAMRRKDFSDLGVRSIWERSLMEDMALAAAARGWSRKIRFVGRAMPVATDGCGAREFFGVFNKWMRCFRVYDFRFWSMGALLILAKIWILTWGVRHPEPWLLAYFAAAESLNLYVVFWTYSRLLPDRFTGIHPAYRNFPLLASLCWPALLVIWVVNWMSSMWSNDIHWGGVHYRLHGPDEVEIIGRQRAGGGS